MSSPADLLLDRMQLTSRIRRWRVLALIFAFIALAFAGNESGTAPIRGDYIARISVEDIILEDTHRSAILKKLAEDNSAKAVVMQINSPGGTVVGGETLFRDIRAISETKPVVAVMGTVAASGGYMVALAADHILAHQGSLTGSIGVLLQTMEATELAQKLGIHFLTFKSGDLKGSPSPFEKLTPEVKKAIDETIADTYAMFVDMVAERRQMPREQVVTLADGRVYTGRQAVAVHLVDALGGEEDALAWLQSERKIDATLPIKDISLTKDDEPWRELMSVLPSSWFSTHTRFGHSGLMVLWQPGL